jgi:hypothetical protein
MSNPSNTVDRQVDDDQHETLAELIQRLRREPPGPGEPAHQSLDEIIATQGVRPIDPERLIAHSPGPLYEGFEEDIRRMRRGQSPRGPRQ